MPPRFTHAAGYLLRGWSLVRQPGLRRFVVLPLLVNLLVFGGLGWLVFDELSQWLDSLSLFSNYRDVWLVGALETVLRWLAGIVLVILLAYVFTLLANLIGAPFNSLLAERVEASLTGRRDSASPTWRSLLADLPRTLASEFAKLVYVALRIIPLLLLQFVPVVNVVAPALLFLFGAWMFAIEYIDYPMGNAGARFGDVRRRLQQSRGQALGFGSAVALASLIPVVNLFVMPVAVAGATALYVEQLR